ncbi:hypothetical protein BZA05DRAFT_84939 [Tricharina praecox]|uniref:uncharacterized protein n=1 Tax=Tricharina praecox TaxID=43433 RepID=UPI002220233C|nr:uncharacterized protein BZA05DRAFT_84939 [Tricharina praecox]KAI5849186.1 hypothetical protein BZA05DRAFT_84939 [Tricharina praecox]
MPFRFLASSSSPRYRSRRHCCQLYPFHHPRPPRRPRRPHRPRPRFAFPFHWSFLFAVFFFFPKYIAKQPVAVLCIPSSLFLNVFFVLG